MRSALLALAFLLSSALLATGAAALDEDYEITPEIQAKLDSWKAEIQKWANDPVLVKAVKAQNEKGPLEGMTKERWKKTRRRDPIVKQLMENGAAKKLAEWQAASNGAVTEAFLSAQQGEKVAFLAKTSSYIHKGKSKFDVPFTTRKAWQGDPEFDESVQSYQLQLSVPVLVHVEGEKEPRSIGVLVVGFNLDKLFGKK